MGCDTHFFCFGMETTATVAAIEELLRPVVEASGYELVDLQLRTEAGRRILRLLVDRPGGITLDECARLSREVGPHLDVADPLRGRYSLEVSSPGLRRPLKRPADFERFVGEKVLVRTRELLEGRKTFRGHNRGLNEAGCLLIEDGEAGRIFTVPLAAVREARLDPDIQF